MRDKAAVLLLLPSSLLWPQSLYFSLQGGASSDKETTTDKEHLGGKKGKKWHNGSHIP